MKDKNPARNDGVTPLFIAAQKGYFKICSLIVENVEDKNPARNNGITPLYIAAKNGHFEICKMIIENLGAKNPVFIWKLERKFSGFFLKKYPVCPFEVAKNSKIWKFFRPKNYCCKYCYQTMRSGNAKINKGN